MEKQKNQTDLLKTESPFSLFNIFALNQMAEFQLLERFIFHLRQVQTR